MMIVEGIPLFMMEYALGQRMKQSAVRVWNNVHPAFFGVGIGCMLVSFAMCLYYIVIITWCVYYFFVSFTSDLPWKIEYCPGYAGYSVIKANHSVWSMKNQSIWLNSNITAKLKKDMDEYPDCCVHHPTEFYWYRRGLRVSNTMESLGDGINWKLFGSLFVGWVITYLCVLKGVKSSGKVCILIFVVSCVLYCFYLHLLALLHMGRGTIETAGDYV